MSLSGDAPPKVATSLGEASSSSISVDPSVVPENPSKQPEVEISVEIHTSDDKSNLSDVATLLAPVALSVSTTEDNNGAEIDALDVETLKIRMKLSNWLCGGTTQKGEPCKMSISDERKAKIESQLERLSPLSQSSENFDDELERLVMLVHCRYHDHGNAKDDRLDLWTEIFPKGPADVLATIRKQIKKALRQVEQQCRAMTLKGTRCRGSIGGQRILNCHKTIDEILQPDVYEDAEYLEGYLRVLEANMYCRIHVDRQVYTLFSTWKLSIIDILDTSRLGLDDDANLPIISIEGDAGSIESNTKSKDNHITKETTLSNGQLATPRNTRSLSPEFYHSPSNFWPSALDTSPFRRLPWLDEPKTQRECYDLVKRNITSDLGPRHSITGYVYLYEVEGNEGFVKLGYTKNLEKRHEDWTFDCNRKAKILYPLPGQHNLAMIPNAPRVEAICHSELNYCNIRVDCRACLKEHVEWFEIEPERCIEVIEKWSRWMRTAPYERVWGVQKMRLSREEGEKMEDMEGFMDGVARLGL